MTSILKIIIGVFLIIAISCGSGKSSYTSKPPDKNAHKSSLKTSESEKDTKIPDIITGSLGQDKRHQNRTVLQGPSMTPVQEATFHAGGRIFASPVMDSGIIYLGAVDGSFNAIRLDGSLVWTYVCNEPYFSTALISFDNDVYIGCDDNTLQAFETEGTIKWTFNTGHDVDSSPVANDDGTIYFGSNGLFAVNPTGGKVFHLVLEEHISASPSIRPDNTIVIGTHDGKMYAVSTDGTVFFVFETKGPILGPAAALDNGDIIFGSSDSFVYLLAPMGGMRWKYKTKKAIKGGIAVSKDQKTAFVPSMDGFLYALDLENGSVLWKFPTDGPVRATPVLDSKGTLFVGSQDHYLYAINSKNGKAIFRLDIKAEIDSRILITSNGKLVVASDDGALKIFREDT